ncbi:mercury resistance system transport protein MerF [Chengkuizengella axinellae]|uniref:Mercury resistance system transport protein MerF n=1 Tax=Chengkuizengella axinellae TaxID=3064388 RepID=A0ABT9J4C5_9BACL|nr:mercury resistance system transport protein MerF [Chengkuizengella sp. 2205SS18-9]MDP5276472.1 mercury resistance system transport protein MerF [Chengkuizengella sp. 2205SS18-9]
MKKNMKFKIGVIGTIVTLICCATPILVITLGLAGLSAVTGYLDYVLIPLLFVFIALMIFNSKKKVGEAKQENCCHSTNDQT